MKPPHARLSTQALVKPACLPACLPGESSDSRSRNPLTKDAPTKEATDPNAWGRLRGTGFFFTCYSCCYSVSAQEKFLSGLASNNASFCGRSRSYLNKRASFFTSTSGVHFSICAFVRLCLAARTVMHVCTHPYTYIYMHHRFLHALSSRQSHQKQKRESSFSQRRSN